MLKISLLFTLYLCLFLTSTAQTYSWTNRSSIKVTVNFKYDRPVGNVRLSQEFNPGQSLTFNNLSGTVTQAIISGGGFWSGKFTILYMGNCPTCNAPGNYDILTPPPAPPHKPQVTQPKVTQPQVTQQTQPSKPVTKRQPTSFSGMLDMNIVKDSKVKGSTSTNISFYPRVTIYNGYGVPISFKVTLYFSLSPETDNYQNSIPPYKKEAVFTCGSDEEILQDKFFIDIKDYELNALKAKTKYSVKAQVSLFVNHDLKMQSTWKTFEYTSTDISFFGK